MKLETVITLANKKVEIPFRAFERSLRATGCTLPLLVIPYDDSRFPLPTNATWLDDAPAQKLYAWLAGYNGHPTFRKYACFLRPNFLFADTDVVFLKTPAEALVPYAGFVISCCHWMNSAHTLTDETRAFLEKTSTTYQKTLFNSGQFACDRALYAFEALQAACERFPVTCLRFPYHEQPAVNILAHLSSVPITSLTLPPHNIESSWAGHYINRAPPFWGDEKTKPFLLHWAGRKFSGRCAVDELFLAHLNPAERAELLKEQPTAGALFSRRFKNFLRGVRDSFKESFAANE